MSDSILNKKRKIQQILNVFETGSKTGDYSNISIFRDGPRRIRQITYGRSQTTEWGNLKKLIEDYTQTDGKYVNFFKPYLSKIGKVSLVGDQKFIDTLKEAGKEEIMQQTQDKFFDEHYWKPALKFMDEKGFTTALSGLIIYDSFIHSGGMLQFLRNRFPENTPVNGGNEKVWIKQYLEVRHKWLANHSNPILRKTIYRTRDMMRAVEQGDWELDQMFNANGVQCLRIKPTE
jgi:chitosanase